MKDEVNTITLTDLERNLLQFKFEDIESNPYTDFITFEREAIEIARRLLPELLVDTLRELKNGKIPKSALLIKNLPLDKQLPSTPINSKTNFSTKPTFVSEAVSVGVGAIIGEIFAFKNEKEGQYIHNNFPTLKGQNSVSNEGATVVLPFHIEDVHVAPFHPDWVQLFCLRGCRESKAFTYLLNSQDILPELDSLLLEQLARAEYYTTPPLSFTGDADGNGKAIPILDVSQTPPFMAIEFTDTKGMTNRANIALEKFKEICTTSRHTMEIRLSPGDLLIFDNRTNLHARSTYPVFFDGLDRWVQRTFLKDGGLLEWHEKILDDKVLNL